MPETVRRGMAQHRKGVARRELFSDTTSQGFFQSVMDFNSSMISLNLSSRLA